MRSTGDQLQYWTRNAQAHAVGSFGAEERQRDSPVPDDEKD
jgi:hypothetical protein